MDDMNKGLNENKNFYGNENNELNNFMSGANVIYHSDSYFDN